MKNFQIIIIVVFVFAGIFGLLTFAGFIKIGDQSNVAGSGGTVVLWGTFKKTSMASIIDDFNTKNKTFTLRYEEKDKDTFNQDLLEALASGQGPDLFLLPENLAFSYSNKIFTIPYESYPIASFQNTFAGAGEVFMTNKGILAFPLSIDPMVMYYNRSNLDDNDIIYPPKTWEELSSMIPTFTKIDDSRKITKSAVSLGQFSNVDHAKDILSNMFLQTGAKIVSSGEDNRFYSVLDKNNLHLILKFYTDFSDPLNTLYSWNKSLASSINAFSSQNLTFYFGYASELQTLINRNPNQNFLVAPMPQLKDASFKSTFAHITGISISSFSKNFNTAFTAASLMASGDFAKDFNKTFNLVPARRDLLAEKKTDPFFPVFYSSALISRSFLDPSPKDTDNIYRNMIDSVHSNKMSPEEAIKDSSAKFDLLLRSK